MLKMHLPMLLPALRILPELDFHYLSGRVSTRREGASFPLLWPPGLQAAGQSLTLVHTRWQ